MFSRHEFLKALDFVDFFHIPLGIFIIMFYDMFISNKDYLKEIEENHIAISDFIVLNTFGEIDYLKVIEKCSKNHDLACCYGLDSTGAELALIFNTQDKWKYFSNNS